MFRHAHLKSGKYVGEARLNIDHASIKRNKLDLIHLKLDQSGAHVRHSASQTIERTHDDSVAVARLAALKDASEAITDAFPTINFHFDDHKAIVLGELAAAQNISLNIQGTRASSINIDASPRVRWAITLKVQNQFRLLLFRLRDSTGTQSSSSLTRRFQTTAPLLAQANLQFGWSLSRSYFLALGSMNATLNSPGPTSAFRSSVM